MTSFLDKMATTREAWLAKLDGININRVDMNKLIMNYLVTGEILPVLASRKAGF